MKLIKDFPNYMGMHISKHCASITTPGKIDSSAKDKKPSNHVTGRVKRHNNNIASLERSSTEMLN